MQMPLHVIFKLVSFMSLMVANKQESLPNGMFWFQGGANADIPNTHTHTHTENTQQYDKDATERKSE